jgi:hypothetical protein
MRNGKFWWKRHRRNHHHHRHVSWKRRQNETTKMKTA